jgi:hypothetical protein
MRMILPLHLFLLHQAQISFVHQGGWLQRVSRSFVLQITAGQSAQFFINNRHHFCRGIGIALAQLTNILRHILGLGDIHEESLVISPLTR